MLLCTCVCSSRKNHKLESKLKKKREKRKKEQRKKIANLCCCQFVPTSLQSVLSDRAAVDAQTGSGVGSHLDLVLSPDDQVFQQTVVGLRAADVLLLVVPWQPGQTVPAVGQTRGSC